MKFLIKPYYLLGIFSLLVFLVFVFADSSNSIDFHIHDTVFIIPANYLLKVLAALLLFSSIIYVFSYQILFSRVVMWMHIIFTLLFTFYVLFLTSTIDAGAETGHESWKAFETIRDTNRNTGIFISLFLLGQLFFLFNIIAGFAKKLFS